MSALRGFGITFDLVTGKRRNWYVGSDGIQRWTDTDEPTPYPLVSTPRPASAAVNKAAQP